MIFDETITKARPPALFELRRGLVLEPEPHLLRAHRHHALSLEEERIGHLAHREAKDEGGHAKQAWAASLRARRTGTHDRRILYHAAAIAAARGETATARTLAERALDGHPEFDLIAAPAAKALLAQLQ